MDRRFRTLARNWNAFGHADPLFAVLSDPTKHDGKWEAEEFFSSGRAHVEKLFRQLEGIPFDTRSCLDFGCGVGRLTLALSKHFARTVGVDVASSMIKRARRYGRHDHRCEFVVNRDPDLRQFADATFDFVYSCLVLQHMPAEIALPYISEFLRITRPGGLIVFQVPSEGFSESFISTRYALPDSAFAAGLCILHPPASLRPGQSATLQVVVTNNSDTVWRHDIPAGRHITIANHWLDKNGAVAIPDDGRAVLPATIQPGESVEVALKVQAPLDAGSYWIEIDLVQELVCWFAEKGSKTSRAALDVEGTPAESATSRAAPAASRRSIVQAILRRFRFGTPTFEMHVIPRPEVERTIHANGGDLLLAIDDGAAGYRWRSYTYVCRRIAVA